MPYLESLAEISPCGQYRYWLTRRWASGGRTVLFVGLNPSTADAVTDDPTIRKCVGFATRWGYSALLMGNLFAYRATNPKLLSTADDPVGPENRENLVWLIEASHMIVAAWGQHRLPCYAHTLAGWILGLPQTRCLGQNQDGSPKHPLYLPYETTAIVRPE
jgi:hypothetical protein